MRVLSSMAFFLILSIYAMSFYPMPSEKVRIATEIRSKTAQKLKNEMDLIPFGFGGQMMDQIKMLALTFQYRNPNRKPIDIDQGREILLQATKTFLNEINSNEKVRPYLDNYPFEPKNVQILIVLQKSDGTDTDKGELGLIVIRDGLLQYKFDDLNSSSFRAYKETYEEALEIFQHQEKQKQTLY